MIRRASTQRTALPSTLRATLLRTLALALVFVGQLCSLVHLVVVPHERCAAHGELIERAALPALRAPGVVLERSWESVAGVAAGEGDEHDVCVLFSLHAWTAPKATPVVATRVGLGRVPAALSAPVLASWTSGRATWRVAPKGSPPVV